MSSPTIQLNRVTLREAKPLIIAAMEADLVVMVMGSPGTGKSEIVHEINDEFSMVMIDHRVSTSDRTDFTGLPDFMTMPDGRRVAIMAPFVEIFPVEGTALPAGKEGWTLFLDEANHADEDTGKAMYKVMLDRAVGQHKLDPRTRIIMAGNLATDNAMVNDMGTAFGSRICVIEIYPDVNEWLADYAFPKGVDPRITAYLSRFPHRFNDFDPAVEGPFCCPRTWTMVSKLTQGKKNIKYLLPLIAGTITPGVASEFIRFNDVIDQLPDMSVILADPVGTPIPDSVELVWATTANLLANVTAEQAVVASDFIDRLDIAQQYLYYRSVIAKFPKLATDTKMMAKLAKLVQHVY